MGKELTTTVVLNGRATSGFNALSDKVTQLGYVMSQLGNQVGEWEKESIDIFKDYETYMLEAKGAMSATAKSASDLERSYADLHTKAQEWASSTIFHTNDVAKAISEAAHAGWDYEKMLQGVPQAMVLAQAGNTDLSSGLDMLIKTINGTGTAFEDSGEFVDQWVMAANSSATTVSELGEAMEKMGATARFGSSTEELLTMLAVLANTGTVGSNAGTLLRNSMIRLIAPTKNARSAMEDLGVEADEINEAVAGDAETLAEVNDILAQAGFSAYTTEGRLKPFLKTFQELYKATAGMTEEQRNKVLSAIFPTRTITGAMALLQAAAEDYDGLLEKIAGSEGYASKIAGIQTSGLMGSQELFLSKWEEFSRKIGEILSEPLESAYSIVGGFLDTLNSADPAILSSIAGAATALAAAGPTLISVGLGMKLFSFLGPWGTGILAGIVGIGALVGYFTKLNEIALNNNFGQMALDMDTINTALQGIGEEKNGLLTNLKSFSGEFDKMLENYNKAGQSLAEGLTSKMIAGTKLTPQDKKKFEKYGEDMIANVKSGITTATAEKVELASLIFSTSTTGTDSNEDLASNPVYASVVSLLEVGMSAATAEAERLSKDLRKAMTEGFADGKLTEAELKNIQGIMDQMNALMAGMNPSDVERNKLLLKSQRVSLESMEAFTTEVNEARDAAFAGMDDQMLDLQATLKTYYDWAKEHGQQFINPVTGELVNPSEVNIDDLIAQTEDVYRGKRAVWESDYNDVLMRGWENALSTGDIGELYTQAKPIMDMYRNGMIDYQTAHGMIESLGGNLGMLGQTLALAEKAFGGGDAMANLIDQYRKLGGEENLGRADWLEGILTMLGYTRSGTSPAAGSLTNQDMAEALEAFNAIGAEGVKSVYQGLGEEGQAAWDRAVAAITNGYDTQAIARAFGMTGLDDQMARWMAARWLSGGMVENPDQFTATQAEATANQHQRAIDQYRQLVDAQQQLVDGQQAIIEEMPSLKEGSFEYDTYLENAAKLEEMQKNLALMEESGINLTVNGDTKQLEMDVDAQNGRALLEYVDGDTKALEEAIDKYNGKHITVYIDKGTWTIGGEDGEGEGGHFAEGGRATAPSIFGEVPGQAEWAIPEAHTARTAELLKSAAAASGFTWGELLAANGGLNAGGGIHVDIQSYAPTINATDARGVAEELAKDKARLGEIVRKAVKSAIENMGLHESIEVYA